MLDGQYLVFSLLIVLLRTNPILPSLKLIKFIRMLSNLMVIKFGLCVLMGFF